MKDCVKLSKASIKSIMDVLSSTTSGLTITLSGAAVDKAFETAEGANDGRESSEWITLSTAKNWYVTLA
jgi:hypothetical protein